jgi:hypothetical protein
MSFREGRVVISVSRLNWQAVSGSLFHRQRVVRIPRWFRPAECFWKRRRRSVASLYLLLSFVDCFPRPPYPVLRRWQQPWLRPSAKFSGSRGLPLNHSLRRWRSHPDVRNRVRSGPQTTRRSCSRNRMFATRHSLQFRDSQLAWRPRYSPGNFVNLRHLLTRFDVPTPAVLGSAWSVNRTNLSVLSPRAQRAPILVSKNSSQSSCF